MAKKYKVIALSVGGLRNKIYRSGELVNDSDFKDADKLEKQGFLESQNTKLTANEKIEQINSTETIEALEELMDESEKRTTVIAAYEAKKAEFEQAENNDEEELKSIEALEDVTSLKLFADGDFSDEVKAAALARIDEIYIGRIEAIEVLEDVEPFIDGDFSQAVKDAATKKAEELV